MTDQSLPTPLVLPGEGEVVLMRQTRVRQECGQCGEVATHKHTYLLPNARRNPASSAYGRDDCSWCSDHHEFTCGDCKRPDVSGYETCSTFTASERFAHMFLRWTEEKVKDDARQLEMENAALRKALIRTVDALDDARNHRYTDARAVSEAARAALKEPQ